METDTKLKMCLTRHVLYACFNVFLGLCEPQAILFIIHVAIGGMSIKKAFPEVIVSNSENGYFFITSILNLIPFIILNIYLFVKHRYDSAKKYIFMYASGLVGILILLIPMHIVTFYGINKSLPGSSTAPIAFIFLPLYAVFALSMGLWGGRVISNKIWKQTPGQSLNPQTSSLAILSVICTAMSLFNIYISIISLVVAVSALFVIGRSEKELKGKKLAVFALIISVMECLFILFDYVGNFRFK